MTSGHVTDPGTEDPGSEYWVCPTEPRPQEDRDPFVVGDVYITTSRLRLE